MEIFSLVVCVCVCVCTKLLQLCLTLYDHMGCSSPGSSVRGILQARALEWVAMPCSRGSSRGLPMALRSPELAGRFLTTTATCEACRKHSCIVRMKKALKYADFFQSLRIIWFKKSG